MKRPLVGVFIVLLVLAVLLFVPIASPAAERKRPLSSLPLSTVSSWCAFTPETGLYRIDQILNERGLRLKRYLAQIDTYLVWTPPGQTVA